jgi:hypothetical protein
LRGFHQVPHDRALLLDELRDAVIRQIEQRHQRLAAERLGLRRSLHLDVPPAAGFHDVHVDVGAAVVLVGQIEQRFAADNPDAGRGDVVVQWNRLQDVARPQLLQRQRQRDEGAGDGRRPRAAVGLNDVAVDPDRPLAERPGDWSPIEATGR